MIAVVFMFGPAHGHAEYVEGPLKNQVAISVPDGPKRGFDPYEFGDPYSITDLMGRVVRHIYQLHDVFENGVEEGAVYFHHEDCCDQDYSKSSNYEVNAPPSMREPKPPKGEPKRLFDGLHLLGSRNREKGIHW